MKVLVQMWPLHQLTWARIADAEQISANGADQQSPQMMQPVTTKPHIGTQNLDIWIS